MPRIPRDLTGVELARRLERFGYGVVRQTGSRMRLTSTVEGREHHQTIPDRAPLKVGTMNSILREVGDFLRLDRSTLLDRL